MDPFKDGLKFRRPDHLTGYPIGEPIKLHRYKIERSTAQEEDPRIDFDQKPTFGTVKEEISLGMTIRKIIKRRREDRATVARVKLAANDEMVAKTCDPYVRASSFRDSVDHYESNSKSSSSEAK